MDTEDRREETAEEMWRESERLHDLREQARLRGEWVAYHIQQAHRHRRTLSRLIDFHEAQARLHARPPVDPDDDDYPPEAA